jgi:hypothetical protein
MADELSLASPPLFTQIRAFQTSTHEIFHPHMTTMEDRFAVNQIGPSPPSPIGASDAVGDPDWNVDAVGDPEGNADVAGVDGDIEYVGDPDGGPVTRRIGSTYGSRCGPNCRSRHPRLLPHMILSLSLT